eukprot:CAMPEP_0184376442 /NCGR_PEP_ID=MMETSP0007-20130409/1466_1 /TAXON_ID=97485 /ORGANISM="Prymnesium parvum, Strain Texoma1" /LENGTH=114 /DNA_ID=CAMNT_0026719995 /DNA_START=643 /DNA_END=983 /DNA_ORIENTATION=-
MIRRRGGGASRTEGLYDVSSSSDESSHTFEDTSCRSTHSGTPECEEGQRKASEAPPEDTVEISNKSDDKAKGLVRSTCRAVADASRTLSTAMRDRLEAGEADKSSETGKAGITA